MKKGQMEVALLERVCRGDREAMDFLARHWSPYVHLIDDLVDGQAGDGAGSIREAVCAMGAMAACLFNHPFYVKHRERLFQLVLTITSEYADSAEWEQSPDAWKRAWADHHRHCGMEMVVAVGMICGGYEHGRAIAREQREICWVEHHDAAGKSC